MKSSKNWTFKIFILSLFLSISFGVFSQSLFPELPEILSIFIILFFIIMSVVFDMINVAITSLKINQIEKYAGKCGYKTALKLCENTEKVTSFCGDVVGDICGILSGAGGVSLVLNMHIADQNINFILTCIVSSLIAGLTIFGKAVMKVYAMTNCDKVIMKTAAIMEMPLKAVFKKKNKTSNKK